jgi:hypothetical protein
MITVSKFPIFPKKYKVYFFLSRVMLFFCYNSFCFSFLQKKLSKLSKSLARIFRITRSTSWTFAGNIVIIPRLEPIRSSDF